MSDLPKGWRIAELAELCERLVDGSHNPPPAVESGKPMLSARNINEFQVLFDDYRLISDGAFEQENVRTQVAPGDVLLTIVGTIGRTAVVTDKHPKFALQRSVAVLKPRGISSKYLAYALNSPKQQQWLVDNAKGTAQKGVYLKTLGTAQIPIAPLSEQTRIVTKLEELLSDLDAGVAELKAAQKKLAQYRQSLLKAAVEGSVSDGAFPKLTLGELILSIGQGWSPKCEAEAADDEAQWAVMKTTAIQPLAFDGAHNKALPTHLKPRVNLELKPGDLLVTRAGPRNRVGITCLVRTTRSRLILCDKAYRIRCDETRINPDFLELVLNAPNIVHRIDELKTGISDSGLNLTQDRFFTLEIPVPRLEVQRRIVEKVKIQVGAILDQEKSIENSLKQSSAQRQNILRAAFTGKLVQQDPNDEPASVLLERIRAEREAQSASKKPRSRKAKEPS